MHYYSQFGQKDFVPCLGYKANVVKEFFLNYKPQANADCVLSGFVTMSRSSAIRSRTGVLR
jgi:glucose-1-phosphate cytidylyltransferase